MLPVQVQVSPQVPLEPPVSSHRRGDCPWPGRRPWWRVAAPAVGAEGESMSRPGGRVPQVQVSASWSRLL